MPNKFIFSKLFQTPKSKEIIPIKNMFIISKKRPIKNIGSKRFESNDTSEEMLRFD